MGISRYAVCSGVDEMGTLTLELGVVFRLRDCLPSRDLGLVFMTTGGIMRSQMMLLSLATPCTGSLHAARMPRFAQISNQPVILDEVFNPIWQANTMMELKT